MIDLPDGFILKKKQVGRMMGSTWDMEVYYRKTPTDYAKPAFEITKQYDINNDKTRYAARLITGGKWQEFSDVKGMVLIMCTKYRIGIK